MVNTGCLYCITVGTGSVMVVSKQLNVLANVSLTGVVQRRGTNMAM